MSAKPRYFSFFAWIKEFIRFLDHYHNYDPLKNLVNNIMVALETSYCRYIEWCNVPHKISHDDFKNIMLYFLGPFLVFKDIGKDIADTFRPYKGLYQIYRDGMQPIRGLINILKGIASIIFPAIVFTSALLPCLFISGIVMIKIVFSPWKSGVHELKEVLHVMLTPLSWIADGITTVIRGATQIAATPLTWIKMLLRGILTAVNGGFAKFEDDDPEIEHEIQSAEWLVECFDKKTHNNKEINNSMTYVINELQARVERADYKGKNSGISFIEARKKKDEFENIPEEEYTNNKLPWFEKKIDYACEYLRLFPFFNDPRISYMISKWFLLSDLYKRENAELIQDVAVSIGKQYYLACRKR